MFFGPERLHVGALSVGAEAGVHVRRFEGVRRPQRDAAPRLRAHHQQLWGSCTTAVLSAGSFEVAERHGAMFWPQQRSRVHVLELQEH